MARGRKVSYDQQLQRIESELIRLGQRMEGLKAEKEDVLKAQRQMEMEQLYDAVKASGRTTQQWLDMLQTGEGCDHFGSAV